MRSPNSEFFLGIGAAGLLLWFLEKHSNNLAKRNSQIWNFQKIGIPKKLEFPRNSEFPRELGIGNWEFVKLFLTLDS